MACAVCIPSCFCHSLLTVPVCVGVLLCHQSKCTSLLSFLWTSCTLWWWYCLSWSVGQIEQYCCTVNSVVVLCSRFQTPRNVNAHTLPIPGVQFTAWWYGVTYLICMLLLEVIIIDKKYKNPRGSDRNVLVANWYCRRIESTFAGKEHSAIP